MKSAAAAAEELAAEGMPVTTRAVRERAGVGQKFAMEAAREWNESADAAGEAPTMPSAISVRLEAIWKEAYLAAREMFDVERQGYTAKIAERAAENEALAADFDEAAQAHAAEAEAARADATRLHAEIAALETQLVEARETALDARTQYAAAESRATVAEGQVSALQEALAALAPKAPVRPGPLKFDYDEVMKGLFN